ncbi:MAG: hypothetical protein ACRYFB_11070 [Janthinobacterium lividum]
MMGFIKGEEQFMGVKTVSAFYKDENKLYKHKNNIITDLLLHYFAR